MQQPHLRVSYGDLPEIAIIVGNPDRVPLVLDHLSHAQILSSKRGYAVGVGTAPSGRKVGVVCHGVGSASTALILEECYRVGVRNFIRVGSAGALQPEIAVGDLIIATAAVRDEGTSPRLAPLSFPATASSDVTLSIQKAALQLLGDSRSPGKTFRSGLVWTTDIFYLPPEEYKKWASLGVLCVEMECSVVFAFSHVRGCRCGAILTIDGNLALGKMKGESEDSNEDNQMFAEGVEREIAVAIRAADLLPVPVDSHLDSQ